MSGKGAEWMKVFSVMRRREDLPAMTFPLALLLTGMVAVFASAAGRLASSGTVGTVAALPFLALSVCAYSLIILLWRRVASLMVTPLSFGAMLATGSSLFAATTVSFSLLVTAYTFAVSLIARESKFRRLCSLSVATAACLVLSAIAYAGLCTDSYRELVSLCMNGLSSLLANAYGLASDSPYVREAARSLLVMTPAYATALSVSLAWFTELLTKSMFRVLGCTDLFIGITHRITLPLPYAILYLTAFSLTMMTIPEQAPFLYTMLSAVMIAMMLPCAAVGLSMTLRKLRVRMYYASQKRALTALLLVFAVSALGLGNALLVFSAVGSYFVIADDVRKKRKQRERENRRYEK